MTFLTAMGISDNPKAIDVLLQEYNIESSSYLNMNETSLLNELNQKMFNYYHSNGDTPFNYVATQKCSDMMLAAGKIISRYYNISHSTP
jgi:hypothetical protein